MNAEIECKIRDDLRKHDLSINEFAVLELLLHKGPQTVRDVKEKILVADSSTSYIINQLCNKELVYREPCSEDRRIIYVQLTEKGEELIKNVFPQHAELITEYFSSLSIDEIKNFQNYIKTLTNYKNTEKK